MTFGRDVQCDSCGRVEILQLTRIYYYVLPENRRTVSMALPIWCFDCDGIRGGEYLPGVDYLTRMLTDLEINGISEFDLKEKESFLRIKCDPREEFERELGTHRAALAWRLARQPPRCLKCGGLNHQPIEWDETGCPHPGCDGRFQSVMEFHAIEGHYDEVDAEGQRVDTDE